MGSAITAFGAGILTCFTPCVLPLFPGYLSLISGLSAKEIFNNPGKAVSKKIIIKAVFFIFGFSVVFALMGATASSLGHLLMTHKTLLMRLCGALMVLFGLHVTGIMNIFFLNYEKRLQFRSEGGTNISAFLIGSAFAAGWSPCIGPVLGSILSLAAVNGTVAQGVFLLLCYSAGMAVPFLLAAFFTARFFGFMARFRTGTVYLEKAVGALLIIIGVAMFFGKLMFIA